MQKGILERIVESPWNYWGSLVVDLLVAGFFLVYGLLNSPNGLMVTMPSLAVGFFAWGLLEYILHRWVFHGPPSIAKSSHLHHHRQDKALVGILIFLSVIVMSAIWGLLSLAVPTGVAALLTCGLYVGYIYYQLIHHTHHHWQRRTGHFARLRMYHEIHHHRFLVNYGVTTMLWDRLFGTFAPLEPPQTS